jgi:hypothetical protein
LRYSDLEGAIGTGPSAHAGALLVRSMFAAMRAKLDDKVTAGGKVAGRFLFRRESQVRTSRRQPGIARHTADIRHPLVASQMVQLMG